MLDIIYTAKFIKLYNKLEKDLKEEVKEKIVLLKNSKNHTKLKVHKLHGKYSDRYDFSVNYKIRIVFKYFSKKEIVLLVVGGHEIYK